MDDRYVVREMTRGAIWSKMTKDRGNWTTLSDGYCLQWKDTARNENECAVQSAESSLDNCTHATSIARGEKVASSVRGPGLDLRSSHIYDLGKCAFDYDNPDTRLYGAIARTGRP